MERIFYYFVKRALTGEVRELPICMDTYVGDIGDFFCFNGEGYIITDYAVEYVNYDEVE